MPQFRAFRTPAPSGWDHPDVDEHDRARTQGASPVPGDGSGDPFGPQGHVEHVWTDTVLTFTDDGSWVEQRCRLCDQVRLLGPDDSAALPAWFDTLELREQRPHTGGD